MRRREMALATAAAVAGPVAAQGRVRRIGILWGGTFTEQARQRAVQLLKEQGAAEGRDFVLVVRSAAGDRDKVPQLARELVAEGAEILLISGDVARIAVPATTGVPVIAYGLSADGGDLAALAAEGHRSRLAGIDMLSTPMSLKRLELLASCLPRGARVLMVAEPRFRNRPGGQAMEEGALRLGLELHTSWCDDLTDLPAALALARRVKAVGLYQHVGSFLASISPQLIELATEARLADMYEWPHAARRGGLMGYGPDPVELTRQFYALAWRVLQGAKPDSLPFEGPMRVHLALNKARAR
ncbi:MAG: ABC transporter substrate binding protein, partial [Aquabacterium sp.]